MGLFSNKKNSMDMGVPPSMDAPPMPSAPPAPSAPPSIESAPSLGNLNQDLPTPQLNNELQAPEIPQTSAGLSAPPIPGGSGLDDIKKQVIGDEQAESEVEESMVQENPLPTSSEEMNSNSDDDLFSMFKTDDEPIHMESVGESDEVDESASNVNDFIDTSLKRENSDLNLETKGVKSDSCFLTTAQFKALLEIVDSVKGKVKDSTDVHLRLMDMKAEEDIEYENLRKSFQHIEDRLYELDSILFER